MSLNERNTLNRTQRYKGTIKTKYFHHPFASVFNFYMSVAYRLERAGLADSFLTDYFLQSAAELQPDSVDVILFRSWLFYKKSQFEDAIYEVDKALDIDNEYAQLWINRGLYCAALGREEDALSAFTKAQGLYPDNPKNINLNHMMVEIKAKILDSQGG